MRTAVIIQANSLIQLYLALAAVQCRLDPDTSDLYASLGEINGHSIKTDLANEYGLQDFEKNVEHIKRYYQQNNIVLFSASHLPYKIINQIGFKQVSKIYRVEEGIGSYGNILSKTLHLALAGYMRLVPRHAIGIFTAALLELGQYQEAIYLIDRNNNVNVNLLNKLKIIMRNLKPISDLPSHLTTLVLTTDFVVSKIKADDSTLYKGHPAWGGTSSYQSIGTYSAERLIQHSNIDTLVSQFSSAGIYCNLCFGTLSISISTRSHARLFTKRQLTIFNKYCLVSLC